MTDTMEYAIKTYGRHLWDSKEQCIELCATSLGCFENYYILYNSDEGKEAVNLLQEFCRLHYFNPNIDVTDCSNYNFIFNCKIDTFINIFRSHSIWDIIRYNLHIPAEWNHKILKEHEIVSNTVFKISLKNTRKLRNTLEIDLEKSLDTYKEFLKQNTTDKYSIDIWHIGNIPSYKCENNEKQIVLKMLQEALETLKIISVDDRFENKEAFGCMWFMVVLEKTYFKELSLKYEFFKYNDIIHDEKGYISIGFKLPLEDNENIINDKEKTVKKERKKKIEKTEVVDKLVADVKNNDIDSEVFCSNEITLKEGIMFAFGSVCRKCNVITGDIKCIANGSGYVIRPSEEYYTEMYDIVKKCTFLKNDLNNTAFCKVYKCNLDVFKKEFKNYSDLESLLQEIGIENTVNVFEDITEKEEYFVYIALVDEQMCDDAVSLFADELEEDITDQALRKLDIKKIKKGLLLEQEKHNIYKEHVEKFKSVIDLDKVEKIDNVLTEIIYPTHYSYKDHEKRDYDKLYKAYKCLDKKYSEILNYNRKLVVDCDAYKKAYEDLKNLVEETIKGIDENEK